MKKFVTLIIVISVIAMMAVAVNAAFGVVVEAQKVDKQPNLEEIDESWGDPVLTGITSASENTYLWKYWTAYQIDFRYNNPTAPDYIRYGDSPPPGIENVVPEDNPMDLYMCWDDKFFYFGVATYDYEVAGWVNKHRGDGIQLQFQPIETVDDPTYGANENVHVYDPYNLLWTLAFDDWSVDTEYYTADLEEVPRITQLDDGEIHFIIAIPLQQYGYNKKNLVDGVEFAIAFLRVSSKSSFDWGYAGGVCWGKYLRESIDVEGPMTATSLNTVILRDPATATAPIATEAPETDPPETEATATEAPATEAPATEAPATEAPATEAPETEAPATEAPATEAPATEAPATEAPATEAPATEAPATEAPKAEEPTPEPAEKNNTGLIIAIVAVVVVGGAVLGIVLGKKKK